MCGRTLNILLVEDNPDHAELVRRSLKNSPVANLLCHVADGESALAYILGQNAYADRARFPAPDVVLLDLRLPRLDGLDVLRRVKAHPATRALPIVVLTTSDMERDAAIAHNHHANSFLTKPVDAERLNQVLQQLGPSKQ